ncbi:MAG TPA: LysR family transcriptional regulator [Azospirillaceae bacterium]|nr:LysR family transcriptional regulator [Azospirillaceae bacterium]
MDRLEEMCLFARVAETRSFTAAAQKLGLSKSVASRRVAELEGRLGARLLNRTTRHISLTEAGEAFYKRCIRILADVEEAERAATDLHGAPRGLLKVAAPMSFGMLHLAKAVADFLETYPEIELAMELNDRFVDLVEEGYDVAVRIGRLKDSSLVARRLCPARRVVCASPGYLKRRGVPKVPEELAQHDCLVYTNNPQPDLWTFPTTPGPTAPGGSEMRGVRVSTRLSANNGDVLRAAAVAGQGIVVLPTFIVGEDLAAGRLEPVLLDWTVSDQGVHCVYPPGRNLSPKVRVFVDFLAGRFGPVPYWDAGLAVLKGG